jgi:hypothetical protein
VASAGGAGCIVTNMPQTCSISPLAKPPRGDMYPKFWLIERDALYLFVFTHYPTQNRFALLLEML